MAKASATKRPPPTKPAAAAKPRRAAHEEEAGGGGGRGRQLVIVESPAKAKTINKYLGPGYHVLASIGHVRDLPSKNPKGVKNPVPGVDLDHDFAPTYAVLEKKGKV